MCFETEALMISAPQNLERGFVERRLNEEGWLCKA